MIEQHVKVRLASDPSVHAHMAIGSFFNIISIEDESVRCYCRPEIFGEHPGMIQLVSPDHIKIMLEGIVHDSITREATFHELTCNPELNGSVYRFSFSRKEVELPDAKTARKQFFTQLGVDKEQYKILNHTFPIGSYIEENTRLINLVKYKNPKCPQCEGTLYKIYRHSDSYLNDEQFESCKAGDYYCDKCPSNGRGNTDSCYWWNDELDRGPFVKG